MQPPLENPFPLALEEVKRLRQQTKIIFVDFHAEATSEKIAFARMLDGQVSAVVGTHTHVQTADEQIFPGGTAYLTDAGFTGPHESVLGREIEPVIKRFLTAMPQRFEVAKKRRACSTARSLKLMTPAARRLKFSALRKRLRHSRLNRRDAVAPANHFTRRAAHRIMSHCEFAKATARGLRHERRS